MLKTFDDLLREEVVVNTLGENASLYFRVLFTDQRGWNIRSGVCHGITSLPAFSWPITERSFHALLVLAVLRGQEKKKASEQQSIFSDSHRVVGANELDFFVRFAGI